jgi:outer membrane protein OmpA-like peptidoglycan-associated protein
MINHQDFFKMRIMKKILYVLIVILNFHNGNAQDLKKANAYFERTFYSEAIPLYENIIKDNHSFEVVSSLANAYYYTNDLKNAERWYRFLLKNYSADFGEDYYFRYMHSLKAVGKQEEANALARGRIEYYAKTDEVAAFDKQLAVLENIAALGNRFEIRNLEINTEKSDFGAVRKGSDLIYTSPGKSKVYKWNNENYLDLYVIPIENVKKGDSIAKDFSNSINTKMHESNAVFTKDGKKMYFTRNNFNNGKKGKDNKKISHLQIFSAEFEDGEWKNIKSLPFNSDNYSTEHPALSPDEQTLYFASDMPGSIGSFDIYYVAVNEGKFSTPVNLGTNINTIHKEQFPFISKDGKLYFSSDGHLGFGSLDVFVSNSDNGEFSKPVNIGFPVNSEYDDFAFTIDSDTEEGYFSSNRIGGKGNDDIYQINETKPLIVEDCKQLISGVITDEITKLPLEGALVILQNSEKVEVQRKITAADGKFLFDAACASAYTVLASKEKYTDNSRSLKLSKERNKNNDASMALKSLETIKQEQETALQQKKKEEEAAKQKEKELAEADKKKRIEKLLADEKDVVRDKDRLLIKTEPIYFDYDLWYIRKESKPILNKVIALMKKYPDMVVEIGSHTDVRGNNKYNLDLSEKRAASTREYFIEQGIPNSRIFSRGYGETVQIVKCVPEESCTEEQHELNRRSEFVIKGI